MNSKENKIEERINRIANKKLDIMEQKRGKKVKNEEIIKVFNDAENFVEKKEKEKKEKKQKNKKQRIKWRNRIIAILGALGITIGGGQALLTSGDDIKEDNIKVTENNGNNKNSNSEFREKIKVDQTEEAKDEKIIDEILEKYNSKLDEENKIDKTDLRNNITKRYGRRKHYRKSC